MRGLEKTILISLQGLFFLDYINEVWSTFVKITQLNNQREERSDPLETKRFPVLVWLGNGAQVFVMRQCGENPVRRSVDDGVPMGMTSVHILCPDLGKNPLEFFLFLLSVFVFLMKKKPQTQELQSAYPEQPLENQKPECEMSVTASSKDLMLRQQSDAAQAPNLKDHVLGPSREPS